jgi:hypothetical protein
MREGVFYFNQFHPTFMSIIIRELINGCNLFLLDFDGAIGRLVHRHCTIFFRRVENLHIEGFVEIF